MHFYLNICKKNLPVYKFAVLLLKVGEWAWRM